MNDQDLIDVLKHDAVVYNLSERVHMAEQDFLAYLIQHTDPTQIPTNPSIHDFDTLERIWTGVPAEQEKQEQLLRTRFEHLHRTFWNLIDEAHYRHNWRKSYDVEIRIIPKVKT